MTGPNSSSQSQGEQSHWNSLEIPNPKSEILNPKLIRLLLIIPTLVRGGAEKQLTLLAGGLARDQFDVHVAVLTHTGPLEHDLRQAGVPLTMIDKRWKLDPGAYWRLRKLIKQLQPDIVHTWL